MGEQRLHYDVDLWQERNVWYWRVARDAVNGRGKIGEARTLTDAIAAASAYLASTRKS